MRRPNLFLLALIIFPLMLPGDLHAAPRQRPAPPENSLYASPFAGGLFATGTHRYGSGPLAGARIGYEMKASSVANSLAGEATFAYFMPGDEGTAGDSSGYLLRFDALYPFILKSSFVPYLALGVGGLAIVGENNSKVTPLLNYGAGFRYPLTYNIAARVDLRHILAYDDVRADSNIEASVGLNYYFGRTKPVPPPPVQKVQKPKQPVPQVVEPVKEEEGPATTVVVLEGTVEVTPLTGSGAPADGGKPVVLSPSTMVTLDGTPAEPATATEPVLERARQAGILDGPKQTKILVLEGTVQVTPLKEDDTSGGEEIVEEGEEGEQEAASVPGAVLLKHGMGAVVARGEVIGPQPVSAPDLKKAAAEENVESRWSENVVRTLTVEFDFGKAEVLPKYEQQLTAIAGLMRGNPDAVALIEGHTDIVGTEKVNWKLSRQRAESVKQSLVRLGADPAHIATTGYGATKPVADNRTESGRQRNRRAVTMVTIVVNTLKEGTHGK